MKFFSFSFLMILFILIFGCTSLTIERGVDDNVFYSTYLPKIKIKISPELVFEGDRKNSKESMFSNDDGKTYHDSSHFVFRNNDDSNPKVLIVYITKIREGYYYTRKKKGKGVFNSEYKKIQQNKYLESLYVFERKGKCYLAKSLDRAVGSRANIYFSLYYTEEIKAENIKANRFSDWEDKSRLNDKQYAYLKKFSERSNQIFQIIQ